MENSQKIPPKPIDKETVTPALKIPKEISVEVPKDFPYSKSELEINLQSKPEIVKPSEEGENWNEKFPKQGYDPTYPDMPTSSGTLL